MRREPLEYEIAQLIYKSIANILTIEEKKTLDRWLSQGDNIILYNKINEKNNIQNKLTIYKEIETNRVYMNLEKKIISNKAKTRKLKAFRIFKYTAIAIIFLGFGYIYQSGYFSHEQTIVAPNENITLQLENGTIKIIKEDGTSEIVDSKGNVVGSHNGTTIVYDNQIENETLVYNTLTVPYGKHFEILLSDGTNVQLNAGTSLRYPVKFIKGQKREVFLKGEAFFNVAKDAKHPFMVKSDDLYVQVLGTKFNVSSYFEDKETDVVLVEGSVDLFSKLDSKEHVLLKPGFKGSFNKKETNISTSKVITNIYTSWVHGELVFRNISFNDILKKMERQYNVNIVNNNIEIANEKFNASFRNEPIEKILEYFKITYGINYAIQENKILIN
jgi:hypothetical protein